MSNGKTEGLDQEENHNNVTNTTSNNLKSKQSLTVKLSSKQNVVNDANTNSKHSVHNKIQLGSKPKIESKDKLGHDRRSNINNMNPTSKQNFSHGNVASKDLDHDRRGSVGVSQPTLKFNNRDKAVSKEQLDHDRRGSNGNAKPISTHNVHLETNKSKIDTSSKQAMSNNDQSVAKIKSNIHSPESHHTSKSISIHDKIKSNVNTSSTAEQNAEAYKVDEEKIRSSSVSDNLRLSSKKSSSRADKIKSRPDFLSTQKLTNSIQNLSHNKMQSEHLLEEEGCYCCMCKYVSHLHEEVLEEVEPVDIQQLLDNKENELRNEFQLHLEKQMTAMKEKFNFILHNEQVRASYMLREAHRERQEKITALQTLLECKNLAGLMYVMCSERRRSQLEIMKIKQEYTNYIRALQEILAEGQALILHLSRGYKTALRVDNEWRDKMKDVIREFQLFVCHYMGGDLEANEYLFDIPKLMETASPLEVDDEEEPCAENDEEMLRQAEESLKKLEEESKDLKWWDRMEGDCPPFIMFGDLSEFEAPRRREISNKLKVMKSAPKKWKEYAFHDMFLRADCGNHQLIKDVYPPPPGRNRCELDAVGSNYNGSRRPTGGSTDTRAGSILRLMTSDGYYQTDKSTLLAAKDSLEIASSKHLLHHGKQRSFRSHSVSQYHSVENIDIKKIRHSIVVEELEQEQQLYDVTEECLCGLEEEEEEKEDITHKITVVDSLTCVRAHVPDADSKINYEKYCPMDKCELMRMSSFDRALPPYMKANPYTHFRQTFEHYHPCSPEQLEIIQERIKEREAKEKLMREGKSKPDVLEEWRDEVGGVATQTSDYMLGDLPPCTCRDPHLTPAFSSVPHPTPAFSSVPHPTPASSSVRMFNVQDLLPMKEALAQIATEQMSDHKANINRLQVDGQGENVNEILNQDRKTFTKNRMESIKEILKKYPSLADLFQGNAMC
ncbi:hypothetical protein JYU34_019509 [Plutella xylostella]|uniref:Uncharacterized protein n=1 Tax=Plutella xylostella TaxID=51655 RepID=A0ABQ7PXN3_PLUXY|nr:hypothetical protein JYU34_019509 [Plutella xylostella]